MSDEKVTKLPDEGFVLDRAMHSARLDGTSDGVLKAVDWLHDQAVLHFRKGLDEEAKTLRNIATKMIDDLLPGTRKDAEQYAKEFPASIRKGDKITVTVERMPDPTTFSGARIP